MNSRSIRNLAALLALLVASRFPDSTLATVVRYSALGYMLLDLSFMARAGYLRRLPYWTAESWRRFFRACAIPIGALVIFACLLAALEFRLPMTGPARSTPRFMFISVALVFMLVGAWGLGSAISWLTEGDASRQFSRGRRRHPLPSPDSAG